MKAILAVVALATIAGLYMMSQTTDSSVEAQFQDFISTYRKSYLSAETYSFRLGVFQQNLQEIASMNAANPGATYAVNEFADWTVDERQALLGFKPKTSGKMTYRATLGQPTKKDINWVEKKETTPVKDQKSCGSCWAFSAIETLESTYALFKGLSGDQIPDFSEQQAVDCVRGAPYGSEGCNGGWMDDVFDYAAAGNKFCTEADYPYKAKDGKCDTSKCTTDVAVTGKVNIPEGNVEKLLEAIEFTPVAVAVDANSFFFYAGGVHKCSKNPSLNHGVQADGFHIQSNDGDYILVRNSWGARWGDEGYIKITTDADTNCGIALAASYPTHEGLNDDNKKCDDGKDADPAANCLCTYGKKCDKTKAHGKDKDGCDDECGCGEFGFCR